jgi:hypothetical protein
MATCSCKNSRTGQDKRAYATQSRAELAAEESRQTYRDGETLKAYYCCEGKCWHVGNSWNLDDDGMDGELPGQTGWCLANKYPQPRPEEGTKSFHPTQPDIAIINKPINSFLKQLKEDAQPAASAIKIAANRVIESRAVQTFGRLGYNGLVNTVGVGLALSKPAVRITKRLTSRLWKAIEKAGR